MEFYNTEVYGFKHAIIGMRNPLQSYDRCDSYYNGDEYIIGEKDMSLAKRLVRSGSEHSKFLRMIHVQVNVDMPRYWWSEADTYHFNTKNSESTMHRLLNNNNPITKDMFVICEEDSDLWDKIIEKIEDLRQQYKALQVETHLAQRDSKLNRLLIRAKRLLPEGFLQMRTWDTNYQELRTMYHQRKNHRLKEEWQDTFCEWVKTLPYAEELIVGED